MQAVPSFLVYARTINEILDANMEVIPAFPTPHLHIGIIYDKH